MPHRVAARGRDLDPFQAVGDAPPPRTRRTASHRTDATACNQHCVGKCVEPLDRGSGVGRKHSIANRERAKELSTL